MRLEVADSVGPFGLVISLSSNSISDLMIVIKPRLDRRRYVRHTSVCRWQRQRQDKGNCATLWSAAPGRPFGPRRPDAVVSLESALGSRDRSRRVKALTDQRTPKVRSFPEVGADVAQRQTKVCRT